MNYKTIANELGLELNDEFVLTWHNCPDIYKEIKFRLTENGLEYIYFRDSHKWYNSTESNRNAEILGEIIVRGEKILPAKYDAVKGDKFYYWESEKKDKKGKRVLEFLTEAKYDPEYLIHRALKNNGNFFKNERLANLAAKNGKEFYE